MNFNLLSDISNEDPATASDQLLSQSARLLSSTDTSRQPSLSTVTPALTSNSTPSNQTGAVITKIENIFESITDVLLDRSDNRKNQFTIQLKTRSTSRKNNANDELGGGDSESNRGKKMMEFRSICFPSRNAKEAWKFAALLRILELSHEALVTGTVTTKRDIYYRDPELFVKQAVVDRYVDDIAYTFGVNRDALNVVAAVKGLVSGAVSFERKDGSSVDCSLELEGLLVPNSKDLKEVKLQDVQWILVIEKEATFRTLAVNKYWKDSQAGKGVIITAKGYPDIQTRQLLHSISTSHPQIPIFALVDFDPDGIGIYSTYKYGSMNLAHETNLAVPSIQWLGLRSCDFLDTEEDRTGMLALSARDRRIARKMLDRKGLTRKEEEWRQELQMMLMLNLKAEIQILGNSEDLAGWLDVKLVSALQMEEDMEMIL